MSDLSQTLSQEITFVGGNETEMLRAMHRQYYDENKNVAVLLQKHIYINGFSNGLLSIHQLQAQ